MVSMMMVMVMGMTLYTMGVGMVGVRDHGAVR
jgi:hypothetical protein